MERIENIGFGGLKLIQETESFCYGIDAVILADFAHSLCKKYKQVADLGSGNGIIPLILSHKNEDAIITGVEIQPDALELSVRNARLNGLSNRIKFVECDVACFHKEDYLNEKGIAKESFDIITCNPPYFKKGGAIPNNKKAKYIARHETTATIEEFIRAASIILENNGHFFMVHRPSRLVDILYYCRKWAMEPKNMRMVVPRASESPNIVMIHCVKGGGRELRVMPELAVYDYNGDYSAEIKQIYTEAKTLEI